MKQKKVAVLVLTRNEEATIVEILSRLKKWFNTQRTITPIIAVVDDSDDHTPQLAQLNGAKLIKGKGLGLGHSYMIGMQWALEQSPHYIMTLDGDGQVELDELTLFWDVVATQNADLVIGSRFKEDNKIKYNYPNINRWGVRFLALYMRIISGVKITDSHGGLRLYSRQAAMAVKLYGFHTYVQESILSVANSGMKIIEVSSAWRPRRRGESRVVRSRLNYAMKTSLPLLKTGVVCALQRWYR